MTSRVMTWYTEARKAAAPATGRNNLEVWVNMAA